MKTAALTFSFILFSNILFAQTEPRVVALYPAEVSASDTVLAELAVFEQTFEATEEFRAKFVNPSLPAHWQINRARLLEFMADQDYFSLIAQSTSNQLTYLLNSNHPVLIVFPVRETSAANLAAYRAIAEKYEVAWVVNFTSVELTKEAEASVIKARLQLYNSVSNWTWIDKEYLVKGGECDGNSWECALADLVDKASADVFELMEEKRHFWNMQAHK